MCSHSCTNIHEKMLCGTPIFPRISSYRENTEQQQSTNFLVVWTLCISNIPTAVPAFRTSLRGNKQQAARRRPSSPESTSTDLQFGTEDPARSDLPACQWLKTLNRERGHAIPLLYYIRLKRDKFSGADASGSVSLHTMIPGSGKVIALHLHLKLDPDR